jgi:hypothetical protein
MAGSAQRLRVRCIHDTIAPERARQLGKVYATEYAPTTFLLFDREVIEAVGPLDEQFFAYWEDSDYLWRLRDCGYKVWVARDVEVIHKVGQASGGGGSPYANQQYLQEPAPVHAQTLWQNQTARDNSVIAPAHRRACGDAP